VDIDVRPLAAEDAEAARQLGFEAFGVPRAGRSARPRTPSRTGCSPRTAWHSRTPGPQPSGNLRVAGHLTGGSMAEDLHWDAALGGRHVHIRDFY